MNVNFPENLTDDFLGLFIGITATIVLAAVIFVGPENLQELALGALVASLGSVTSSFLKAKASDGS